MAMVDLAGYDPDHLVSLHDLSLRQNLPLPYLEQLFARLNRQGLVKAVRGPKGGYTLAKSSQNISIADVVLAADEEVRATRCKKHDTLGCTGQKARCLTHNLWHGLDRHLYNYLEGISLADVRENTL